MIFDKIEKLYRIVNLRDIKINNDKDRIFLQQQEQQLLINSLRKKKKKEEKNN